MSCPHGHPWQARSPDQKCPYCLAATLTQPPDEAGATLAPQFSPGSAVPDERSVPGYEILDELGRGGMGVVYKARQLALDRLVALKMILHGGHAGPRELARFQREAEAIARLQHPNIVQVFEVGEHAGMPFLSLEYVEGGTLAARLEGTPLPAREAAGLIEVLARAVAVAHERGVVHRDLKPANVLLTQANIPKITDFGLARKLDEQGHTQTGAIVGTPSYMAPEQADGRKDVGPAVDIYALGAILYECLTGRPPFRAATPLDTILQVVTEEPVPPRLLQPRLPRDLETITLKCLHKEPAKRYASAVELADDLRRYLDDEPIHARRPGALELGGRWLRKQRRSVLLAGVAALASAILVFFALLALAAYHESQLGKLELTTDGPALTAEVLSDRDTPVLRFTVPTAEPVALPSGAYHLRLGRPGSLTETWKLELDQGYRQRYSVRIDEREPWPARTGFEPFALVQHVQQPRGADLVVVEPNARTVHYLEGNSGKLRWSRPFLQATAPKGRDVGSWINLIWFWQRGEEPALLSDAVDFNADGFGDLVLTSRQSRSLVVLSGKDGSLLWWYQSSVPLPPGVDPAKAKLLSVDSGRVVGQPVLLRENGKTSVVLRCFSQYQSVQVKGHPLQQTGPQNWIERVEFGNDRPSWRVVLSEPFSMHRFSRDPVPRTHLDGKEILVLASGQQLLLIETSSGAVSPLDLGQELLAHDPVFFDLPGPDTGVLVQTTGDSGTAASQTVLVAASLRQRRILWTAPIAPERTTDSRRTIRPVLLGNDAVIVWTWKNDSSGEGRGSLRALRLENGTEWWTARLQPFQTSSQSSPAPQVLVAEDLDGDSVPDLFLAYPRRAASPEDRERIFVYALSGAEGHTLWWREEEATVSPLQLRPLFRWQPGAEGRAQLLVATMPVPGGGFSGAGQTYILNASNGKRAHLIQEVDDPKCADVDGDGLPDLYYIHAQSPLPGLEGFHEPDYRATQGASHEAQATLHLVRGQPGEVWRRLGSWDRVHDLDGDGLQDVVRVTVNSRGESRVTAVSGRTGDVLWPGRPERPPAPSRAPSVHPATMQVISGRLYALPLPWGDLDRDGHPDLVVATKPPEVGARQESDVWPYQALSGRTGRPLWPEERIPGPRNQRGGLDSGLLVLPTPSHDSVRFALPRRFNTQPNPRRGGPDRFQALLVNAKGRVETVAPLFTSPVQDYQGPEIQPRGTALDLGRGQTDLVCTLIEGFENGVTSFALGAFDGTTGKPLWHRPLHTRLQFPPQFWPPPVASDLDGDGLPEVILLDQDRLLILRADNGEEKGHYQFPQGVQPLLGAVTAPLPVRLTGKQHGICFAQSSPHPQLVLLDAQGKLREAILCSMGVVLHVQDLEGDGPQEVLVSAHEGKVRALRNGLRESLWVWPAQDRLAQDWKVEEVQVAESITVVVRSRSRREIHVLQGKTGKSLWRNELPDANPSSRHAVLFSETADEPRLLTIRPGRDTLCRLPLAPSTAGEGATRLPEESLDPRRGRPLPWAALRLTSVQRPGWLGKFLFLTGVLYLVPGFLLRRAWPMRQWRAAVPLLTWFIALIPGFYLMQSWDYLDLRGAPPVMVVFLCYLVGGVGLLLLVPLWWMLQGIWRRRWGLVALMLGLFLTITMTLIVGLLLWDDRLREPDEQYTLTGLPLIFLPGYVLTSIVLVAGRVGGWIGLRPWDGP